MRLLDRLGKSRLFANARSWAWANLAAQIVIIFTGGLVRLSGAGLGCSTWPLCEPGQFTPQFHAATSYHPFVEFGNRTMTGVLTAIAVGLVLAVRRGSDDRRLRRLAWWPLAGVAAQALLGGLTVLLQLNPAVVSLHMFVSLALVSVSMLLVRRLDGPLGPWTVTGTTRVLTAAVALLGIVLAIAGTLTTGAGPHSGDDQIAYRLALDPAAMAKFHAVTGWAFLACLAGLFWAERRPTRAARLTRARLVVLTVIQGAVGYLQYFTGLPIWLVSLHMVLAAVFAAAVTDLIASRRQSTPAAPHPRERTVHA